MQRTEIVNVYYNENDPFAAAWLRKLIGAGLIAPGEVDERSILEVQPADLVGFTQCHFFAGIGVWSYALRNAGWADDSPVWTGSCPCQSFSQSGKRGGFTDPRHLWPAWFRLIRECRPDTIFGEQVASRDGLAWLDVVCADLEGEGYAVGAADLCAAGFGAPHIRQRLYFVAESEAHRRQHEQAITGVHATLAREAGSGIRTRGEGGTVSLAESESEGGQRPTAEEWRRLPDIAGLGEAGLVADAERGAAERQRFDLGAAARGIEGAIQEWERIRPDGRTGGELDNPEQPRLEGLGRLVGERDSEGRQDSERHGSQAGPTNGFWRNAEWLPCRDGKLRPVEPGVAPLAHGVANRVGKLRGFGNAIVAPVAEGFVRAYMACREPRS